MHVLILGSGVIGTVKHKFVGALRLPGDETGNCFKFTQNIAKMAEQIGVKFHFEAAIERIDFAGGRVTGVATSAGQLTADTYLAATCSDSPQLVKPLGIDLPVIPSRATRSPCPSPTRVSRPSRRSWTKRTRLQ